MVFIPLVAFAFALAGTAPKPAPLVVAPQSYAFRAASMDGGGLKLTGGKGSWWTTLMFPGGRFAVAAVSFDGGRVGSDPVDFVAPLPSGDADRRDLVIFVGSGGIEKLVCRVDRCELSIRHRDGTKESASLKRSEAREVSAVADVDVSVQR